MSEEEVLRAGDALRALRYMKDTLGRIPEMRLESLIDEARISGNDDRCRELLAGELRKIFLCQIQTLELELRHLGVEVVA